MNWSVLFNLFNIQTPRFSSLPFHLFFTMLPVFTFLISPFLFLWFSFFTFFLLWFPIFLVSFFVSLIHSTSLTLPSFLSFLLPFNFLYCFFNNLVKLFSITGLWLLRANVNTWVFTVKATLVHLISECLVWRGVQLSESLLGNPAQFGPGGGSAEMQTVPVKSKLNAFSYMKDFNGEKVFLTCFFRSLQVFISLHINSFIPYPCHCFEDETFIWYMN